MWKYFLLYYCSPQLMWFSVPVYGSDVLTGFDYALPPSVSTEIVANGRNMQQGCACMGFKTVLMADNRP